MLRLRNHFSIRSIRPDAGHRANEYMPLRRNVQGLSQPCQWLVIGALKTGSVPTVRSVHGLSSRNFFIVVRHRQRPCVKQRRCTFSSRQSGIYYIPQPSVWVAQWQTIDLYAERLFFTSSCKLHSVVRYASGRGRAACGYFTIVPQPAVRHTLEGTGKGKSIAVSKSLPLLDYRCSYDSFRLDSGSRWTAASFGSVFRCLPFGHYSGSGRCRTAIVAQPFVSQDAAAPFIFDNYVFGR